MDIIIFIINEFIIIICIFMLLFHLLSLFLSNNCIVFAFS